MRFDQLQAASEESDDGPIAPPAAADQAPAPGTALVRVEPGVQPVRIPGPEILNAASAAGSASKGPAATASGVPNPASESTAATAEDEHSASIIVVDPPESEAPAEPAPINPLAPAVLAVGDIIRTAADQAAATWRGGVSVPAQRRESPVVHVPPVPPQAPPEEHELLPPPTGAPLFEPESPEPESPVAPEAVPEAAPGATSRPRPDLRPEDHHWPGARRQISLLFRVFSALILAVLVCHRFLPDVMGFGSLIDTFLPWTFVPLALAVPITLLTLDRWAIGVTVVACGVWGGMFAPQLARGGGSGPADLKILSQNVASPPDLAAVARLADRRQADVVVLQGLSARDAQAADQAVPARYPYHLALYEFVVWSRFKLVDGGVPMDLAALPADPNQAAQFGPATSGQFGGLLRFTVQLDPARTSTVYAVHLPQPSLSHNGFGVARGVALEQLVAAVKAEREPNLIVVGDLDLAQTDRGMGSLLNSATGLQSVQAKVGTGFGFTWPSNFPMVRLDDVLTRGLIPVRSVVLPAVGPRQAHRPIEADLRFPAAANTPSTAPAAP